MALASGLWSIVRGPHRVQAMIFTFIAMVPAGFWTVIGYSARQNWSQRWVPNTVTMRLAKVMGATFMRAEADLKYPRRSETSRLVMYYDELDRPDEDLAAMDRHLARLEQLLGGTIQARVYWVRGPLLGEGFSSFHGLALGSHSSPEIGGEYRGDRHELAHAALDWFRVSGSDPPYVLHEGWAMAQCGDRVSQLAQAAASSRLENPSVGIRELLGPDWYYRDPGPVYSIGGAFVDFLIRTRGATNFRRFYCECQPTTVDTLCREISRADLADLESEFWADVERTLRNQQLDN